MEIEEGQAKVIEQFVIKLQLWKPPPLLPISLPLTLPSSLSPLFYLSLISSSFKELRILLILICLACLLMEPGVISKVLSYNKLLEELDVSNVRELEDFLIIECTYAGIVKGKLNQLGRCFEPLLATFRLATSDSVPPLIEEKIVWASKMCQLDMDHQQELQGRIYEAKKDINFKSKQGHCFWEDADDCGYLNGPLEQEEDPI